MAMAIARSSGIQSDNAVHGCPNEEDGLAERKDMDIVADGETGQAKNGMDIFCSLIILYWPYETVVPKMRNVWAPSQGISMQNGKPLPSCSNVW